MQPFNWHKTSIKQKKMITQHITHILLTASFLCPAILSVALFVESNHSKQKKLMGAVLIANSLIFFFIYLYISKLYDIYYPFHALNSAIQFTVFPTLYLYIRSITFNDITKKKSALHYIPALGVFVTAVIIFYVYEGKENVIYFLSHNREGVKFTLFDLKLMSTARYIDLFLLVLQGLIYSAAFIHIPRDFNERLRNEFSNIEYFSVQWINKFNLTFALLVAVGLFLYAILPLKGMKEIFIIFWFFLFSMFICLIGIISLKQNPAQILLEESTPSDDNSDLANTTILDETLAEKLLEFFEQNQPYLQPDLTLTSVCKALNTNRTYLSTLINQQFGINFNTFVNRYRVNYVQELLTGKKTHTQEEIAITAGFGSISSMKRAIKKADEENPNQKMSPARQTANDPLLQLSNTKKDHTAALAE